MNNILFFPAKSLDDINSLDTTELVEGYMIGFIGGKKPTDSRSQFVGWKNGMVDSGRMSVSKDQRKIAREYVSSL